MVAHYSIICRRPTHPMEGALGPSIPDTESPPHRTAASADGPARPLAVQRRSAISRARPGPPATPHTGRGREMARRLAHRGMRTTLLAISTAGVLVAGALAGAGT